MTNYPSDLTDAQWEEIAEPFPQGPNSYYHKRSLPHDFPKWSTVHAAQDYEILTVSAETTVRISQLHTLLKRLG